MAFETKKGNLINPDITTDANGFSTLSQPRLDGVNAIKVEGITDTGYKLQVYWKYHNDEWNAAVDESLVDPVLVDTNDSFALTDADTGKWWILKLLDSNGDPVANQKVGDLAGLENLNGGF